MGKDVILDRYARLYEIPRQLALLGHDVCGYCLDYHSADRSQQEHCHPEVQPGKLTWRSEAVGGLRLPWMMWYPLQLLEQLRAFRPDVLIGASDIPHVVLGSWMARRLGVPYAVDLYDNFEGYGQARIPGFVTALRNAARNASLVLTTSEPLRQLVMQTYGAKGRVVSMPSSVDLEVFYPGDKREARLRLGLPLDAPLIGTAGGLNRDKGVEPIYEAWAAVAARNPSVRLVLAGTFRPDLPPPHGDRVHYLGSLDHAKVADLFRALDVGIISILDTLFGRYCFPQKAYEMLACGLRLAVADVGEMSELFSATPQILFAAGDFQGLVQVLERQLSNPVATDIPVRGWSELLMDVEPLLSKMATQRA